MDTIYIIITLAIFLLGIVIMIYLQKKGLSYAKRIFLGLFAGILFGAVLQLIFGSGSDITKKIVSWIGIVGSGYIAFLQMLIIPLILVSLIRAFTRMKGGSQLGKISSTVLVTLLGTTAIAAIVGIFSTIIFRLSGADFTKGIADSATLAELTTKQGGAIAKTIPDQIISFIPRNIFSDMANTRPTSTIAVVIFSVIVGIAFLGVKSYDKENSEFFARIVDSAFSIVDEIVGIVLLIAPYGIFALMTKTMATSSFLSIKNLGIFILASYFAIIVQFLVHMIILMFAGVGPVRYIKKAWPALSFAFSSRSSAGTLPVNVDTQVKRLGVDETSASFSSSFGLTIGQNGCAGIYPAMLAAIVMPSLGMDILEPKNLILVIAVVVLSSFGVAGVGGGATFASLIVFGTLGLPIEIIGLLVSIEPIIDMARTALNVNDSMLAGVLSAKRIKKFDKEVFLKD